MENPLKYSLTTRFKDRHILRLLAPAPGEKVLDVGCGIGYLLGLAVQSGTRVFGIDLSPVALKKAVSFLGERTFSCASAANLPFRDGYFDKIIFADVIEHVADDGMALAEITRVCREGASIVVTTPEIEAPFTETRMKTLLHSESDELLKNIRDGYSLDKLSTLMRSRGIEVQEVVYTNFYLAELMLGLTKVCYYLKNRSYKTQADLVRTARSPLFNIYKRLVFPVFLGIGRAEEWFLQGRCKGHCLIIQGQVEKKKGAT
ncbi:MAG: methyltransferase domain-containing protein [Deltaproteobacteria bacterium]|nr:methyltransferase domain-containing protein [Deltaproteobacteria bacterium]